MQAPKILASRSPTLSFSTFCYELFAEEKEASSSPIASKEIKDSADEIESEKYLSTITASEWKKHDLYKILGIGSKRMTANDNDLKLAYRSKVVLHHPDKKDSREDNIFKCIQKAYDILTDPARRRQFDSVDPTVNDTVPNCKSVESFDEFAKIFKPIFESQQRFSKQLPVPDFGVEDSSRDVVEDFYSFWLHFESWRSFEWNDEEEPSSVDNRDDKRWFDKKNKAARLKRKNEDNARIIKLVELAYKLDPRVKSFKEQDKAEKEAKKQASASKRSAPSQASAKAEEERKAKEQLMALAKQKAIEDRNQKEKSKQELKDLKKEIKDFVIQKNYFISDPSNVRLVDIQLAKLEQKFSSLSLGELRGLKEDLQARGGEALNAAKKVPSPAPKTEAVKAVAVVSQQKEWSPVEMQFLIEAVKSIPGGSQSRWEKIAAFVAQKSKLPERSIDEIVKQASSLKQAPKADGKINEILHATQNHQPKSVDARIHANAPTEAMNVLPDILIGAGQEPTAAVWTPAEHKLLEQGLRDFPATDAERWEKIAALVPGKTKKDCKKRFIEISEMLKSKAK